MKFAVAKDEAFNFIYPQIIAVMEQLGEVKYFSPMCDNQIPNCDFVYLPGGYPEIYLKELSENKSILASIPGIETNIKVSNSPEYELA